MTQARDKQEREIKMSRDKGGEESKRMTDRIADGSRFCLAYNREIQTSDLIMRARRQRCTVKILRDATEASERAERSSGNHPTTDTSSAR